MAVITVRFVASPSFVGSAIRWATNSIFQHTEFGTPQGTWIGAHAGSGIEERPANYGNYPTEYLYEIPCTDPQLSNLLTWARAKCGQTPYNYKDIAGLLFHARKLTSPQRMICSQFCTEGLLETFGPKRVLNVQADYAYLITPETLHLSPIFAGNLKSKRG